MLTLTKVHDYTTHPTTGVATLVRENHYMRFCSANQPPMLVQHGQIYGEGGDLISPVPDWFWESAAHVTPASRLAVGLVLPSEAPHVPQVELYSELDPVVSDTSEVSTEPILGRHSASWTCNECGEVVNMRAKGLHVARHVKKNRSRG